MNGTFRQVLTFFPNYGSSRTLFHTDAAGIAFFVIDDSQVIHHGDGFLRTISRANTTAYAAVFTNLPHHSSFIVGTAGDHDLCFIWQHPNYIPGTSFRAQAAAGTLCVVYNRQPVRAHGDSIEAADPDAVAKAQTSPRAGFVSPPPAGELRGIP